MTNRKTSKLPSRPARDLAGLVLRIEGLVVRNNALRPGRAERDRLKVFWRNIWKNKVRIRPEAKAAVELGLSKQFTALRALLSKHAQSFAHEARPQATTLMLWQNRDGAQPEPSGRTVGY